ncbi:MAG: trans-2,3-dihydro-3-hydroxyanthranilate isomerase [Cyclobacteriaceae bacterium]|jgi:trans-2,3-dihydro-3-hydroxyanthranilate isomerase
MPDYSYYLLDVFTSHLFGGNQLALFPDASEIDPDLFQKIALEFNIPETVFLFPPKNEEGIHSMRIFTPRAELPTAGHPTIGTAHFITAQQNDKSEIELDQKIGRIKVEATYLPNGEPDLLTMYQPLPIFGDILKQKKQVAEMLSLREDDIDNLPIQEISCGNNFLFVPLKSANILGKVKVNLTLWEALTPALESMGIYVFSIHDVDGGEVKGRMFAPAVGINEDPATGSANGPLACYLSRYNLVQFPITSLQGFEMGRPSYLHLDIVKGENGSISAVKVAGRCKLVGHGELFLNMD